MDLRWDAGATARGSITLLHGLNGTAAHWWRVGPGLARQGWNVTALDLPGHGDGPPLTRAMDIEQLVDGVLDRIPPEVDFLIAHSMGCSIALEVAERRPGRLGGLVLEDPSFLDGPEPELAELLRDDAKRYAEDLAAARVDIRRRNPTWLAGDVERVLDGILRAQTGLIADGLAIHGTWRTAELLAGTTLPTLVLLAEPPRSVVVGARLEQVYTDADHVVQLPGGHSLHFDAPADWLRHVDRFLAAPSDQPRPD